MSFKEKLLNFKQLSKKGKESFLISNGKINSNFFQDKITKERKNVELYDEIIQHTLFLPDDSPINERIYCIFNDISELKLCECGSGKALKFQNAKRGYWETCGKSCQLKHQKHSEKITGKKRTEYQKEQHKQTILDRYGSENISQTHMSDDSKKKLNDPDWMREHHHDKKMTIKSMCRLLSVHRRTVNDYLKKHNIEIIHHSTSYLENEMADFLDSLDIKYERNNRSLIKPQELDFFLPDFNIAIEMNGLYRHSTQCKPSSYHQKKTEKCEDIGIRLIHIFEDEWIYDRKKCEDTLKHFFGLSPKGVYGRNVTIREIQWKVARDYLNKYHLLNSGTSGSYNIGAFDKDDNLVAVMVFGKTSNESGDTTTIELKRFVTNKNNNPGVGSKMFKFAVKSLNLDEIIAFVDRRWFTGLVKSHIGFEVIGKTQPALWYIKGNERYHRRFKTKQQLIKDGFDPTLTKREMLESMGYYQLFDSGKLKLKYINN